MRPQMLRTWVRRQSSRRFLKALQLELVLWVRLILTAAVSFLCHSSYPASSYPRDGWILQLRSKLSSRGGPIFVRPGPSRLFLSVRSRPPGSFTTLPRNRCHSVWRLSRCTSQFWTSEGYSCFWRDRLGLQSPCNNSKEGQFLKPEKTRLLTLGYRPHLEFALFLHGPYRSSVSFHCWAAWGSHLGLWNTCLNINRTRTDGSERNVREWGWFRVSL